MTSKPSFFPSYTTPLPPHHPTNHLITFHPFNFNGNSHKRAPPPLMVSPSISPIPLDADNLERKFGGRGVRFESLGDFVVAKMGVADGSSACLLVPSGVVTSYRPMMWHGAPVEVLHTDVSEGRANEPVVIRGGVSLDLKFDGGGVGGMPWALRSWALNDVRGSPEKFIEVELVSMDPEYGIEAKCTVTLNKDSLASELTLRNLGFLTLQFSGSITNHLTVSTPDATYAIGLQGSSYRYKKPVISKFSIIPPDFVEKKNAVSSQPWIPKSLQEVFPRRNPRDDIRINGEVANEEEEEEEEEEEDDSVQLTEKMSRIYTNAPREFTVIDRGKRNSVVVGRLGFEELYVFSPGSKHEYYGRFSWRTSSRAAAASTRATVPGTLLRRYGDEFEGDDPLCFSFYY